MTIEEAADQLAGNWRKFESFAWSEAPEDGHLWALIPCNHRDMTWQDRQRLRLPGEREIVRRGSETLFIMRARHWAVGWMDHIAVKVKNADGSITPDFQWLYKRIKEDSE